MIKRVTLKDIAERAEVSVSTVSYALNDESTVTLAEATRSRIRRIAHDLGYVPNSTARALQSNASRTIGVLLDKPLSNLRYATITQGLRRGLAEHGYDLLLIEGDDDSRHERWIDDARSGRIDGLVLVGHDEKGIQPALEEAVRRHSIPFVALDCGDTATEAPYATVDFDYAAGVRDLIATLWAQGVRTIVYVRPDLTSRAERQREQALMGELTAAQGTLRVIRTLISDATLPEYERDMPVASYADHVAQQLHEALLQLQSPPKETAVVCSWGADVEFAYRAARRYSGRLTVSGLASGTLSEAVWPNLIYSHLPLEMAGHTCAVLILEELSPDAAHRRVLLTPTIDRPRPPHLT